ncbi:hypothetical protein [Pseudomonas sp. TE3610]
MTFVTRDVFDAKIETIETRMDARLEAINAKFDATSARIDNFMIVQAERDRRFYEGQELRDKRLDAMSTQMGDLAVEMRAGFSSLRTTILVTAVTATIAIVLGVASFNATLTNIMLAAFQLGKSVQITDTAPYHIAPPAPEKAPQPAD